MLKSSVHPSAGRSGFSLLEVTLAIGIVGVAILSLVGILGSTFQQVDDIMQTNRSLAGVTRLVAALDSPRSIIAHKATDLTDVIPANDRYLHEDAGLFAPALEVAGQNASNFEMVYRLMCRAKDTSANSAVWLYVYDRKVVTATADFTGTAYMLSGANPSVMEVATAKRNNDEFNAIGASSRNVVGTPMRVRLTLSKLLIGQRFEIGPNGEPTNVTFQPGMVLPDDPNQYALAYLPVVAEFFAHDYARPDDFKNSSVTPLLVQNIVISR
jgi:Tfp pilus assembly protein PilV